MARETAVESTEKELGSRLYHLTHSMRRNRVEVKLTAKIIRREGLYCRDTYSINRMHNP